MNHQRDGRMNAHRSNNQEPYRVGVPPELRATREVGERVQQTSDQEEPAIDNPGELRGAAGDVQGARGCEQQKVFQVVAMSATDAGDRFGIRVDMGTLQPLRIFRIEKLLKAPRVAAVAAPRISAFRPRIRTTRLKTVNSGGSNAS